MGLRVSTAATADPVSVPEAKDHLRIDHNDENALIKSLIQAATNYCEVWTRRAFVNRTYTWTLDSFPNNGADLIVPRGPLCSVTSIAYVDGNGDTQTFDSSNYVAGVADTPGSIRLAYGCSWPGTRDEPNAVTVTYVAGYTPAGSDPSTNPTDVPAQVRQAILLTVGHLYANREAVTSLALKEAPMAVDALLSTVAVREFI